MKLLLLGLLALGTQAFTLDCGDYQTCCDEFAKEYTNDYGTEDGKFTCHNDGSDGEGEGTSQFSSCFECLQDQLVNNKIVITRIIRKGCTTNHMKTYCSVPMEEEDDEGDNGGEDNGGEDNTDDDKVDGPSRDGKVTDMRCNQYLMNTCCMWGENEGRSKTCTTCLAANNRFELGENKETFMSKLQDGTCTYTDMMYFCETKQWDLEMKKVRDDGMFKYMTQEQCEQTSKEGGREPKPQQPSTQFTDCEDITNAQLCIANTNCVHDKKAGCLTACSKLGKARCKKAKKRCLYTKDGNSCSDVEPEPEQKCSDAKGEDKDLKKSCKKIGKAVKKNEIPGLCKLVKLRDGKQCFDILGDCKAVDDLDLSKGSKSKMCLGKRGKASMPEGKCEFKKGKCLNLE